MINPLSLPAGPPRLAFDRPWTLRDPLVVGRGTNTGQRYALAEPLYLSGRLSYLRTATQGYWPETPTIPVDHAARAPTLRWTPTPGQNLPILRWIICRVGQAARSQDAVV